MKTKLKLLAASLLLSTIHYPISTALAQGTAFTYQGALNTSGSPATGLYDFQFSLSNAPSGGSQVGTTVTNLAVGVTNGLFTTGLDFGAVFTGNATWLAISARTNGVGSYVGLHPLQSLTPTPYAVYAANAGKAASANSVSAANLVGTIPAAQLPASVLTNGEGGVNLSGAFTGNGGGLSNVSGMLTQVVAASANFTAQANTAYDLTNSAAVSVTLPANANVGDVIQVIGTGAGGWQVMEDNIVSWPEQWSAPTSAYWIGIASSADGTHLVAVAADGGIYTSANSGVTWTGTEQTSVPTSGAWSGTASSADGTHLVAVAGDGGIFTSANSGVTWTKQMSAPAGVEWDGIASSADGTHLVAVAYYGAIYTSANSGVTWTEHTSAPTPAYWQAVASSADGTHLVVGVNYGGGIYTSADSGVTWTAQTSAPTSAFWSGVASSSDGSHLVAVDDGGGIYTSPDSGVTWTEQTSAPTTADWNGIASSADGTHLMAVASGSGIYTSADTGVTWTAQTSAATSADWYAVASSSDGTQLVAGVSGGGIYTSLDSVTGAAGTSEQFQYFGNGFWQPLPPTAGYLFNGGSTVLSPDNGSGLTSMKAANLTGSVPAASLTSVPAGSLTGTIADGRLSANVALRSGGNAFTGNQIITNGYLGIGLTTIPTYPLEVASNGVLKMTLDSSGNLECSGTVYSRGVALTSDRSLKENFTTVDNEAVLAKVAALPLSEWNYKSDSPAVQHIGPMAQDFHAAFGLAADDKHISVVDEGGVALAAIQGLNQKVEGKSQRADESIQILRAENTELKRQNDALTERLNELEATVKTLVERK